MKNALFHRAFRLAIALAAASALGGCAVYEPAPAYYGDGGGVVYAGPSVYVAPPVFVAPPSLYFGFRSGGWGYRGYHRGYYGGHGWYGRH